MIIVAPEPLPAVMPRPSVFLAGAIDQGNAEDWQRRVGARLAASGFVILNPRRERWDSTWPQDPEFGPFAEQVRWELDALEAADVILMNFPASATAPVSLLELGLHARSGNMVVCCPGEYWRAGNVLITCQRYGVPVYDTLDAALVVVEQRLNAI